MELDKRPVTITYENALDLFRNQLNQKFPPELSSSNNKNNRKTDKSGNHGGGRGGRFHGRGGSYQVNSGRGRSGGRGRGRSGSVHGERGKHRRSIQDAQMLRYKYESQLDVHPSYDFTNDDCHRLPEAEIIRITE